MRLPFNSDWYSIKDYLIIIFGLLLYALGWVGFLIPNEITTGGVTGISALIHYGTGIPISVSYFVINVLLLFVYQSIFYVGYNRRYSVRFGYWIGIRV